MFLTAQIAQWYEQARGKITYTSGKNSKIDNGANTIVAYNTKGSTDSVGALLSAMYHAGGTNPQEVGAEPNYSMTNILSYLKENKYERKYSGPNIGRINWDVETYDIVFFSSSPKKDVLSNDGNVGIMTNPRTIILASYAKGKKKDSAIIRADADKYLQSVKRTFGNIQVWRYNEKLRDESESKPKNTDKKPDTSKKKTASDVEKKSDQLSLGHMWRFNDFYFGANVGSKKKSVKKAVNNKNTGPTGNGSGKIVGKLSHIFDHDYYVVQSVGRTPFSVTRPDVYPRGEHTGYDLSTDDGANGNVAVYACCTCHYVDARYLGTSFMYKGWGFITDCPELGGYIWYGHLSSIESFTPGQEIKAGTKIGIMGDAGGVFHVHFEHNPDLSFGDGDYIDPTPLIPGATGVMPNNTRIKV